MKTIGLLLVIGFLFTQTPSAFALSEFEEGYQWAKEQDLSDDSKCNRALHKEHENHLNEDEFADFSSGCLQYVIDDGLASHSI